MPDESKPRKTCPLRGMRQVLLGRSNWWKLENMNKEPRNPETLNTASLRQECNTTKAVRLWDGKRFVILLLCSNLLNWLGIIRIWTWVNAAYPQTINSTFNCSRCQQHLKHVSSASNREGSSLCRQIAIELTTHCRIDSARTKLTIWSSSCSKLCKH